MNDKPELKIYVSDSPNNNVVRGKCSILNFTFNQQMIDFLKTIPGTVWCPELKGWEVRNVMMKVMFRNLENHKAKLTFQPHFLFSESIRNRQSKNVVTLDGFDWVTEPYPYQVDGVKYGIHHPRFFLGDQMGLGKTKQIIDIFRYNRRFNGMKKCLVICGVNGNKYNWAAEVALHSEYQAHILGSRRTRTGKINPGGVKETVEDLNNLPSCAFLIINIERLRGGNIKRKRGQKKSISQFPICELIQKHINSGEIGMVVVDEIHRVKNPNSLQSQALMWLNCERQIGVSGTLVVSSPLDLYVPFKWMGFECRDYWSFQNRYAVKDTWGSVIGYQNAQELIDILSTYQLRRLKTEVLDLPPISFINEYVELSDDENKVYNAVQKSLCSIVNSGAAEQMASLKPDLFDNVTSDDPLVLSIRLRQVTADTSIVSDKIKKSSKLDRMEELAEEVVMSGGKCIIFSNWITVTNIIRNRLSRYNPAYITGEVPQPMRMAEIQKFQDNPNCNIIIGTTPVLGTGFSLTAANTVIFVDEPWTMADKNQAAERAHRATTKWPITVYTLMAKDTVDEYVHDIVENKGDLADLVVDGVVNKNKKEQLMRILIGADQYKKGGK